MNEHTEVSILLKNICRGRRTENWLLWEQLFYWDIPFNSVFSLYVVSCWITMFDLWPASSISTWVSLFLIHTNVPLCILFLSFKYSWIGYFNESYFALKIRKSFFHELFIHSFGKQHGLSLSTFCYGEWALWLRPIRTIYLCLQVLEMGKSKTERCLVEGTLNLVTFHHRTWLAETERCRFILCF